MHVLLTPIAECQWPLLSTAHRSPSTSCHLSSRFVGSPSSFLSLRLHLSLAAGNGATHAHGSGLALFSNKHQQPPISTERLRLRQRVEVNRGYYRVWERGVMGGGAVDLTVHLSGTLSGSIVLIARLVLENAANVDLLALMPRQQLSQQQ